MTIAPLTGHDGVPPEAPRMPRTTAGPPHGPAPIVSPPDRPCAHAAASPRTAPLTRGASTCSTHPSGLAARHQAPSLAGGTRSRQRSLAAGTDDTAVSHGLPLSQY